MFQRNEPRPLNWKGLSISPSSFNLCLVRDSDFSSQPMVLMVDNKADIESDDTGRPKKGKPRGIGLPGGGVNIGDLDTINGAANRELEFETGLKATVKLYPLIEEHWLLILDKRTGALLKKIPYDKGQQPSTMISPSEKAILNPFYVFSADIQWQGSLLRKSMLRWRNEFIEDGVLTRDDIDRSGLYVNDLSDEELEELEVKEIEEIAGFALLPVGLLLEMSRQEQYHLDPPDNTVYVYRSHVDRILYGLEIMKIIGKKPTPKETS